MQKLIDFFNKFVAGEFGYGALKDSVKKFDTTIAEHPDMSSFMALINSFADIIPYIMIASMFLILFWGKKLLPIIKFITSFAVGFGLGVYFIAPLIDDVVSIPVWISGIVIGILAAIIYRLVYVIFFAVASFYSVYTVCYALLGNLLNGLGTTKAYAFMGVAAVGMLLMFIFRKYVEMFGTSYLGALVILKQLNAHVVSFDFLDMRIAFASGLDIALIALIALVPAIIGFIVQVKTRKRY